MKKNITIIILFFMVQAFTIFAIESNGYGILGISVLDINGEKTTAIKFEMSPELKLKKFEIGIKASFYLNEKGFVDYNDDGKKNIKDTELRLRFIGWDGDIIKIRYGEMDDFTLGTGTIVYRYSNNEKTSMRFGLHHPERYFGFDVFAPLNYDITGKVINEKERPNAFGARVYVRPLFNADMLTKTEIGVTYAFDGRDYYNKFYPVDYIMEDGTIIKDEKILMYDYKKDEFGNFELDENGDKIKNLIEYEGKVEALETSISLPIIEDLIVPYYSYSKIYGKIQNDINSKEKITAEANGHFTGIMGNTDILKYKFELRKITENFVSGYFGRFYETNYNEYMSILTDKEKEKKETYGAYGNISIELFNIIILETAYEYYKSQTVKPTLYGSLEVSPMDKLRGKITYQQKEIDGFKYKNDFLNENTYLKGEFVFPSALVGIPGPFILKAIVNQKYFYDSNENKYFPSREYTIGFGMEW